MREEQRRSPGASDSFDVGNERRRAVAAVVAHPRSHCVGGAFAHRDSAGNVDPAHARVRGKRDELGARGQCAVAESDIFALRERNDRTAFRRFVGKRRKVAGPQGLGQADAFGRQDLRGLPVAQGDRSRLVEQKRVDVAGRFDRAPAHRQHVSLQHAIHARDSDGRKQSADRRRDQADQQRDQHRHARRPSRVERKRAERYHGEHEDQRQTRKQNRQRDFVRRLLALGALDERDHAVQKRLARIRADPHQNLVR